MITQLLSFLHRVINCTFYCSGLHYISVKANGISYYHYQLIHTVLRDIVVHTVVNKLANPPNFSTNLISLFSCLRCWNSQYNGNRREHISATHPVYDAKLGLISSLPACLGALPITFSWLQQTVSYLVLQTSLGKAKQFRVIFKATVTDKMNLIIANTNYLGQSHLYYEYIIGEKIEIEILELEANRLGKCFVIKTPHSGGRYRRHRSPNTQSKTQGWRQIELWLTDRVRLETSQYCDHCCRPGCLWSWDWVKHAFSICLLRSAVSIKKHLPRRFASIAIISITITIFTQCYSVWP